MRKDRTSVEISNVTGKKTGSHRTKAPAANDGSSRENTGAVTIDAGIERLHQRSELPAGIGDIVQLAKDLNTRNRSDRVRPVERLLEIDRSLGLGGYLVNFDGDVFSFYHIRMYDNVYRPIKCVYMDICQTIFPANWSQDIAESSHDHVKQCLYIYLYYTAISAGKDDSLEQMLQSAKGILDRNISENILLLDQLVNCRTNHDLQDEQLEDQFVNLAESLIVYFVCRSTGITLLETCGAMKDIANEILRGQIQKGVLIGNTLK